MHTGRLSQVTYRVLLEFITQVNDAYNDGGITYNKFIIAEYGSGHPSGLISHEIAGSNPASASNFRILTAIFTSQTRGRWFESNR